MEYSKTLEMHKEFTKYLNTLGIPAISTEYYQTNYIGIKVQRISELADSKIIALEHSSEIITHFKNLLKDYNHEADYDKYEWDSYLVSNIYSLEADYIDSLVRNSKQNIIEEIDRQKLKIHPKYIFCHSSSYEHGHFPAGYNIVFKNKRDLKKSEEGIQKQIIDICNDVLVKKDNKNQYNPTYISFNFFDATNCNLYGLSRED